MEKNIQPISLNLKKSETWKIEIEINKKENLTIPKDPNFNIRLASNIEQEPEALTWALVSQKWNKKIGSLQRRIKKKQKKTI